MKVPKYIHIKDSILADIQHKRLKPGDRLPTREELAKRFQVTRTTIAKVFEELNRLGVVSSQTRTGTFVSGTEVTFNAAVISTLKEDDICNVKNDLPDMITSMIMNSKDINLDFLDLDEVLKNNNIVNNYNALIWVQPSNRLLKQLSKLKDKSIVVNRYPENLNFVSTDHRSAIKEITSYYIKKCKDNSQIFYLEEEFTENFVESERQQGFIDACAEHQKFYRTCKMGFDFNKNLQALMELPIDPTLQTIIISPDRNFTGPVLSMAREKNLDIGKELFYSDFDNVMSLQTTGIQIPTILQDYSNMGKAIMKSVKKLGKEPIHKLIPYKIVGL